MQQVYKKRKEGKKMGRRHWNNDEYDEYNMTEKEKQDYFDRHIDEIPEGCLACGGPYPTCKDSCALFDD